MISYKLPKQVIIALIFAGGMIFTSVNVLGVNLVPVVAFMEAKEVERGGTYFTARVFGYKTRNCTYLRANPYIKVDGGDVWIEDTYFQYLKDRSPDSSRPMGKHDFGYWQWSSYGDHQIDSTLLVTEHDCSGNIVKTSIGPFS